MLGPGWGEAALETEGQAASDGVQPVGCGMGVPGSMRPARESLEAVPATAAVPLPVTLPQVKLRCRKGIPSSLRAKAWQYLSNSKELLEQNPGKFEVRTWGVGTCDTVFSKGILRSLRS